MFYKDGCLNYSTHLLLAFQKNSFSENFRKLFNKTFVLESFIQALLQAFLLYKRPLTLKGLRPF